MIGVITNPDEEPVAREFFELFKTPWEIYRPDRRYDVVLCTRDVVPQQIDASLLLAYRGRGTSLDVEQGVVVEPCTAPGPFACAGNIPIYGDLALFPVSDCRSLVERASEQPVLQHGSSSSLSFVRVGYDLFREVRLALTEGQPSTNAESPTVDAHIGLLRKLIVDHGVPLVEIPPTPHGFPFIVCLTHDVDHASIRRHKLDSTVLGFLYRAVFRSVIQVFRGRLSLKELGINWLAAARWPFIHMGLARDFWNDFDRYVQVENGRPSTFFFIPFERRPGRPGGFKTGAAPSVRATAYDVSHVADKVRFLVASGREIGLHGIDAWCDEARGREELDRITTVAGRQCIGVRMHWLYLDENSPRVLESAGFSYDSTVGYNDTVGYRAGTSQPFKPLAAKHLLEIPMQIMDTAMFYPGYLNLSREEAWDVVERFIRNATRDGGVLTLNWHDRSIAPERLWGGFYSRVLTELSAKAAWFATAGQATNWFRKRRAAVFEETSGQTRGLLVRVPNEDFGQGLPALRVRLHSRPAATPRGNPAATETGRDVPLDCGASYRVGLEDIPYRVGEK